MYKRKYYINVIPNYTPLNWNAPVANQYDLAIIQLSNYIPWNVSVAVPATAVPWYSITRYGWGSHGVPFFGPNNGTQYVIYSPLIQTGYPFNIGTGYGPYMFDDGVWVLKANYTGPVKIINGFYYENTYVINPILPGTWQYIIAQLPPMNVTIHIKTEVKPQQAIVLLNTTLLKIQLQQPQGMICGNVATEPGEVKIPKDTYIVQPIIISKAIKLNSITIFVSYESNLATAKLVIATSPIIDQKDIIYTYTFEPPWWCLPHSWATPITAYPNITLKPGTYYIILTFPVQGQTICEQIPNTSQALLINATTEQIIRQLTCTLGIVMTINASRSNSGSLSINNVAIDILNNKIEIHGNQAITINSRIENITNLALIINVTEIQPNAQLVVKLSLITQEFTKQSMLWYLIPILGLIPTYLMLILAALTLLYFRIKRRNGLN